MTPQEQNIAIAEACGWKPPFYELNQDDWYGTAPGWDKESLSKKLRMEIKEDCNKHLIPSYTTDLNAMHEAEKIMPIALYQSYMDNISNSVRQEVWPQSIIEAQMLYVCATAAQRAEAFLRTLNLWK